MVKCELCQREVEPAGLNNRSGARAVRGVYLCRSCEPSRSIIKRYTNFQKAHLTDGERAKLAKEGTVKN